MVRIFTGLGIGLFLLIAGIFVLDINFYLGLAVIGIGAVTAFQFNIKFLIAMIKWSTAKGEENRRKRELRKRPAEQNRKP